MNNSNKSQPELYRVDSNNRWFYGHYTSKSHAINLLRRKILTEVGKYNMVKLQVQRNGNWVTLTL